MPNNNMITPNLVIFITVGFVLINFGDHIPTVTPCAVREKTLER